MDERSLTTAHHAKDVIDTDLLGIFPLTGKMYQEETLSVSYHGDSSVNFVNHVVSFTQNAETLTFPSELGEMYCLEGHQFYFNK